MNEGFIVVLISSFIILTDECICYVFAMEFAVLFSLGLQSRLYVHPPPPLHSRERLEISRINICRPLYRFNALGLCVIIAPRHDLCTSTYMAITFWGNGEARVHEKCKRN
jgi:hypothetical protein